MVLPESAATSDGEPEEARQVAVRGDSVASTDGHYLDMGNLSNIMTSGDAMREIRRSAVSFQDDSGSSSIDEGHSAPGPRASQSGDFILTLPVTVTDITSCSSW